MIMKLGNGMGISGVHMHMHAHAHTRAYTEKCRGRRTPRRASRERKGKVLAFPGHGGI
jgi:hypothetical protein